MRKGIVELSNERAAGVSLLRASFHRRDGIFAIVNVLLVLILLILLYLMLSIGQTNYSFLEVFGALFSSQSGGVNFIIKNVRFPRMMAALLSGVSFGMAGAAFQKLLQNRLASPDILGVTSGSSAAAVFSMLILGMTSNFAISAISLVSGLIVALLIYLIAYKNGFSNTRLILVGIGMQAFLNAFINAILLKGSSYDTATALRWLSGSLNSIVPGQIMPMLIVTVFGALLLSYLTSQLNVLELGDSYAKILGMNVNLVRILIIFVAIFMLAFASSVTGPIAAISFLSGPIASKICRSHRYSVLTSGFVGAILVSASDLIALNVFNGYPVGVITGILGAPYLIYLLLTMNRRGKA